MPRPDLRTFNQLAPMMVQKYERYLPSAFDESLTLLEKLNKIIEYLHQIGKISNDLIEQWNEVVDWVMNEGLTDAVSDKLDEMVQDGTFDTIINQTIFTDLNEKIDSMGVNVKTYGAKGDGVTDDTQAIQDAIDYAHDNGSMDVLFPVGVYVTSSTLKVGLEGGVEEERQPVRLKGLATKGSFLGTQPVVITRTDSSTHTILETISNGTNIENICLNGKGTTGTLLHVKRGFEFSAFNFRAYNSKGYGILAQALSNASFNRVHVDECGSATTPAFKIKGNSNYEYVSNSTNLNNVHLERNNGTDLNIGHGNEVDDLAEFVFISGLHVEGTIDNSQVTEHKTVPHVLIGSVRGVEIVNSFFYGGKGDLLKYEKTKDISFSPANAVSIQNSYFLGYMEDHKPTSDTPDRLINLVTGNGVYIQGCQLDNALVELIKIGDQFGKDAFIFFNHVVQSREGGTSTYINDTRLGLRKGIEFSTTEIAENAWAHKSAGNRIVLDASGTVKLQTNTSGAIEMVNAKAFVFGGQRHYYGTQAPTTGTYKKGDIMYNTAPTAGGYMGWTCVDGDGTWTGVWKGFGLIQA